MLDSKFFFTLVGLIVAVFAICNINMKPNINEGFGSLNVHDNSCHLSQCNQLNNYNHDNSHKSNVNYYIKPKSYDTLSQANIVENSYESQSCNKDNKVMEKNNEYYESHMPVGDMTSMTQEDDTIVYDRQIHFPDRTSRLKSLGDVIRGDLPILPTVDASEPIETRWFSVDAGKNDLQQGFLNMYVDTKISTCGPSKDVIVE